MVRVGTLTTEHGWIHAGRQFCASDLATVKGKGTVREWLLTIEDGTEIHLSWLLKATGWFRFAVYERPTVDSRGNRIPSWNSNRRSERKSNCHLFASPSIADRGTVIRTGFLSSDNSSECNQMLHLIGRSRYLFYTTKVEVQESDLSLCLTWSEHDA